MEELREKERLMSIKYGVLINHNQELQSKLDKKKKHTDTLKKTISELALKLHTNPPSMLTLNNISPRTASMTPMTLSSNKNPSTSSLAYDTSPGGSRRSMMLSNKRDID